MMGEVPFGATKPVGKPVKVPFKKKMVEAIESGKKSCTSRYRPLCLIGDFFVINYGVYQVYDIQYRTLEYVKNNLYQEEGFDSPEEFEEFWKKVYKKFDPDRRVYVHFFNLVGIV